MEEYENDPSQKPESLLERIIKASSNQGEIVLDPFGGSFSTGAVATRLGRKTIGIELNSEYYKIGIRRTGISDIHNGEILKKDKSRKTKNLSKKNREKDTSKVDNSIEQISIFLKDNKQHLEKVVLFIVFYFFIYYIQSCFE